MKLKKQYAKNEFGMVALFDDAGKEVGAIVEDKDGARVRTAAGEPRCTHVEVIDTGIDREQNFSHRMVEDGIASGYIAVGGGRLTIKTGTQPLTYDLIREPGYYCQSSGARIPISQAAWVRLRATRQSDMCRREALAWLAANGKDERDYVVTHAYECVLDEACHNKYRAVLAPTGDKVAAYKLEA